MIYHVKGTLDLCEIGKAVVDCGGVGYFLTISDNTHAAISPMIGQNVKLYTYLQVREDGVELFGFASREETETFRLLITVSGVGPKAAMAILSILTPEKFALAVATEDTRSISKASGVGAKTAARIILELKDKVAKGLASAPASHVPSTAGGAPVPRGKMSEALDALMVLGYSRIEAQAALRGAKPEDSVETMIRDALAALMRN